MSDAKQVMLERIRSALGEQPSVPEVPRDYRRSAHLSGEDVTARFVERVEDYRARVVRCDQSAGGIAAGVADGLDGATRVVVPSGLPGEWLPAGLDPVRDDGTLSAGELDECDAVVTAAAVGIAETGTIVLDGSADQGRRAITLVPDLHVCVVRTDQLVASVPEGVAAVAPTAPQTWISGPSATSDIELDRVEGVHGPRTLVVVLVADA